MPKRIETVPEPNNGSIPFAIGQASNVRIPVPRSNGLCIEFRPRAYNGFSTSTLFIQDQAGKRLLRLDYGRNPRTNTIDYHWNQKGVAKTFGITDHQVAGRGAHLGYHSSRPFRVAGRPLIVVGAALDALSIVQASKPFQRATEVVSAWAGAWAGCEVVGAGGAAGGTIIAPGVGTAIGGVGGCIIGGIGGYLAGEQIGRVVYSWAEGVVFTPLPEIRQ